MTNSRMTALKRNLAGFALSALCCGLAGGAWAVEETPLPPTLSAAGRAAVIENAKQPAPTNADIPTQRAFIDKYQDTFGALQRKHYAVELSESTLAGVPVRIVRPAGRVTKGNLVLMDLHGGGFITDSGSQTENIPIAALTGIPVVAVRYRLAPEHVFPAAVDDALAVYKALLKTHKPSEIGVYGTSAGAVLGPQLLVRLRKEGLPEPAVFGMFSGDTDFSKPGDTLHTLPGGLDAYKPMTALVLGGKVNDPMVSPALGAVDFFPPTLCITSSRDFFLSSTSNFCRQLELAGVENKLVVFDGLPHAFWSYLEMPESDQAFSIMAKFLGQHLKGANAH